MAGGSGLNGQMPQGLQDTIARIQSNPQFGNLPARSALMQQSQPVAGTPIAGVTSGTSSPYAGKTFADASQPMQPAGTFPTPQTALGLAPPPSTYPAQSFSAPPNGVPMSQRPELSIQPVNGVYGQPVGLAPQMNMPAQAYGNPQMPTQAMGQPQAYGQPASYGQPTNYGQPTQPTQANPNAFQNAPFGGSGFTRRGF